MLAISRSIQSKPPIPNDKPPVRVQPRSSIFTEDSDKRCVQAATGLLQRAWVKSTACNAMCKDFFQSSATIRLRASSVHSSYSTTTLYHPEGKESEITFPINSCGKTKELGEYTAEHEMMHQFVLAMAGSDNSHGVAAAILFEMGVPTRNAAPTIDLAQPGSSTSGRQSASEVVNVFSRRSQPLPLLERRAAVKRKGNKSSTAVSAPKVARLNQAKSAAQMKLEMKMHLQIWRRKTQEERNEWSITGYAAHNGLNCTFINCASKTGLTKRGVGFLGENPDKRVYTFMTGEHLLECVNLLEAAQEKSKVVRDYAIEQGLNLDSFRNYVNREGLSEDGKMFLEKYKTKVLMAGLAELLEIWRDMPKEQREEQGGTEGYAKQHDLNLNNFEFYANESGLTTDGKKFIDKHSKKVRMTVEHLERWAKMSAAERKAQGGVAGYARKERLQYTSLEHYLCATGLTKFGIEFLEKNKRVSNPKRLETSITPELDDPVLEINEHTYDNTQAYVRDAQGRAISLASKKGRLPKIELSPDLEKMLEAMSAKEPKKAKEVRDRIRAQADQWLKDEGSVACKKLDDLLEVRRPNDKGPSRGNSVFAKKCIKKFDVIGFYAGELHRIKNGEYAKKCQDHGKNHVESYAFSVNDKNAVLSAYKKDGNVLCMINSIQPYPNMPTHPAFAGMENNLQPCTFGSHGIFLVAIKKIKPEEELFLDYGPEYRMHVQQPMEVVVKSEDDAASSAVPASPLRLVAYRTRKKGAMTNSEIAKSEATELIFLRSLPAGSNASHALFHPKGWHQLDPSPAQDEKTLLGSRFKKLSPQLSAGINKFGDIQHYFHYVECDVRIPVAPEDRAFITADGKFLTQWRVQTPDGDDTGYKLQCDRKAKQWYFGEIPLKGKSVH